ncbi:hypothetical protein ACLOJK_007754 [Asimina triloba]
MAAPRRLVASSPASHCLPAVRRASRCRRTPSTAVVRHSCHVVRLLIVGGEEDAAHPHRSRPDLSSTTAAMPSTPREAASRLATRISPDLAALRSARSAMPFVTWPPPVLATEEDDA